MVPGTTWYYVVVPVPGTTTNYGTSTTFIYQGK